MWFGASEGGHVMVFLLATFHVIAPHGGVLLGIPLTYCGGGNHVMDLLLVQSSARLLHVTETIIGLFSSAELASMTRVRFHIFVSAPIFQNISS